MNKPDLTIGADGPCSLCDMVGTCLEVDGGDDRAILALKATLYHEDRHLRPTHHPVCGATQHLVAHRLPPVVAESDQVGSDLIGN